MSATLYVAISSHGYGHIAQTAPVVNELYRRMGDLRIVVECAAPREVLARRFDMSFEHVAVASDFGMVMKNALEVDVAASHSRYVDEHARLDAAIEASCKRLLEHGADLLLANVPYVPLIAAKRLGLPAIAMCSLNWADIYQQLCGRLPGAHEVHRTMLGAYQAAGAFLKLDPGMDMPELRNARVIGPVASLRSSIRKELFEKLHLGQRARLVTVSMGGIATDFPLSKWPRIPNVTWVMQNTIAERSDMVSVSALGKPFIDIMCSGDALITKPGYGAFVEAACHGVPVLYVPRVDWPEAPYLVTWLQQHGACRDIPYDELFGERLAIDLDALWRLPKPKPVAPSGVAHAAEILQKSLTLGRRVTK